MPTPAPTRRVCAFLPRGLSRVEAAFYVGVSPNTFDKLVAEGHMPKPKHLFGRRVWDRLQLDYAFDALGIPGEREQNDWD
jgi:predicted DNA-binding transcriptional regulator AlpA